MKSFFWSFAAIVNFIAVVACSNSSQPNAASVQTHSTGQVVVTLNDHATYSWINQNILSVKCMDCHSTTQGDGDGLEHANFDSYENLMKVVIPGNPSLSDLYTAVQSQKMPKGMDPMPGMPNPPPPVPLTADQLQAISDWISSGAPNMSLSRHR